MDLRVTHRRGPRHLALAAIRLQIRHPGFLAVVKGVRIASAPAHEIVVGELDTGEAAYHVYDARFQGRPPGPERKILTSKE